MKIIAIFWGISNTPTKDFANYLNGSFFSITGNVFGKRLQAPLKYIPMFFRTMKLLFTEKPEVVFVVNTPVFAPLTVYIYSFFSNAKIIMDIHGHSLIGKWKWAVPIQRFLAKKANVNLIDHNHHKQIYDSWGANLLMLERPPIKPPQHLKIDDKNKNYFSVTYIGNFMGDEPIDLLIDAAGELENFKFFILGDLRKADKKMIKKASSNIFFTGYLYNDDYWKQLMSSDAIIVLTTSEYSLVSGGIESMSLGKPLILSRQPALTDYFNKGTVFVDHNIKSIKEGLNKISASKKYKVEMNELAKEKRERWESVFKELLYQIESQN